MSARAPCTSLAVMGERSTSFQSTRPYSFLNEVRVTCRRVDDQLDRLGLIDNVVLTSGRDERGSRLGVGDAPWELARSFHRGASIL
jgi:hypothetical protein